MNRFSKGIEMFHLFRTILLFLLSLKGYIVYVIEMIATAERLNNSSTVTFNNGENFGKKRGITFGIQSAQSIPE
jgi:hypothetical protein